MPPVFGPVSPSPTRLKSCAAASGRAAWPWQSASSETSSPTSSSSTTTVAPGLAERAADEARLDRRLRRGAIGADRDALAGREPVGLDDARAAELVDGAQRLVAVGARPVARRRHAGGEHQLLRERLRALDERGARRRAEDGDARAPQRVAEAEHERQLRPDHDEPGLEVMGQRDEPAEVVDGDVVAGRDARDARVAGRAVQFATGGARGERLRKRVLPPARADEQDPHRAESTETTAGRRGGAISAGGRSSRSPAVTSSPQVRQRQAVGRHAAAAADVGGEVVGLGPAEVVDAEAAERDDHGRERAAALGQLVARAQRALAVALARDEAEILEPAQAAGEQVGRDRVERAREVAVARDAAQQVANDQQRPAIADGVERRGDRAVVGVGGHGVTLHRIVT